MSPRAEEFLSQKAIRNESETSGSLRPLTTKER